MLEVWLKLLCVLTGICMLTKLMVKFPIPITKCTPVIELDHFYENKASFLEYGNATV